MSLARYPIKAFGKEYYKMNAGFLILSFILIFGYGLFIKTAGHIPAGEERTIYLVLLLNFVQSPIITLIACALWLLYTFKCWLYVWKASRLAEHTFWRYSINALPLSKQFYVWFMFQLYLFIPLVIYWLLATIYGLIVLDLLIPLLCGLYLIILVIISTFIYLYRFNFAKFEQESGFNLTALTRKLRKTPFNAFFYEILLKHKIPFLITKIFSSIALLILKISIFEVDEPIRLIAITALVTVIVQSVIVYLEYRFSQNHLYFIQQLPYSRIKVYTMRVLGYCTLLLLEYIGICFILPASSVFLFLLISLSGLLLIRAILYFNSATMKSFLKWVFIWFSAALILVLYDLPFVLILINLAFSFAFFYFTYYKRSYLVIK